MVEFLRQHQLNIMLFLTGICSVLTLLSFFTRSMPKKRRHAIMFLELYGALLLIFDRFAYIYRGNPSELGWWMVRISNFCVYLFSLCIIHAFNLYLIDLFTHEIGFNRRPKRLITSEVLFAAGIVTLIISQFTGFYYTFDECNRYQRAGGFLLSYTFPSIIMLLQISVIVQYYKKIDRKVRISLLLFSLMPFIATLIQLFVYGISLQNIAMVGVVVVLYLFVLLDMNKQLEYASQRELEFLRGEQKDMRIMFDQTATALANAIDAKDEYTHGHSMRVAEYAQKIAIAAHKDEKFCADIYYAGLLHDVGKIGISNNIINKNGKLSSEEYAEIKKHPVIGRQILSSISKSPYLSIAANSHHERYDGHGYPEGLKGEDIPEIARIIAVADSYDAMTSKRSYRDPIPQQKVREEIVKGMGTQFDPYFAKIMLHIIDLDTEYMLKEHEEVSLLSGKDKIYCEEFRSEKTEGILLMQNTTKIHFHFQSDEKHTSIDSIPSIIIFDSLDARIHETEAKRKDLLYMEYGSLRIDGKNECLAARKFKLDIIKNEIDGMSQKALIAEYQKGFDCDIEAVKVKDHISIKIESPLFAAKLTAALPDSSHYCYIGLTGQHCVLSNLEVHKEAEPVEADYITRIAEEANYITGPDGDLPSIQIDGWRTSATQSLLLKDGMKISFHTMSLPTARLIWHCPFISLYYSDDKMVNGENYKEFVLIRLDGENWESDDYSTNTVQVNKSNAFEGWDKWKEVNKAGMDCTVFFKREGRKITVTTENAGISIKCVSVLKADYPDIYISLTGDQCVITNIKIN